jgi:hypothetical protein
LAPHGRTVAGHDQEPIQVQTLRDGMRTEERSMRQHTSAEEKVLRDKHGDPIAGRAGDGSVWVSTDLAEANRQARIRLVELAEEERLWRQRLQWLAGFPSLEAAAAEAERRLAALADQRAAGEEVTRRFEADLESAEEPAHRDDP